MMFFGRFPGAGLFDPTVNAGYGPLVQLLISQRPQSQLARGNLCPTHIKNPFATKKNIKFNLFNMAKEKNPAFNSIFWLIWIVLCANRLIINPIDLT